MPDKQDPGQVMLNYFRATDGCEFPTFQGFARSIGVTVEDIRRKKREDPAFSRAYDECREIQKSLLVVGGLSRKYDPSLVRYLLSEMESANDRERGNAFRVTIEVVD